MKRNYKKVFKIQAALSLVLLLLCSGILPAWAEVTEDAQLWEDGNLAYQNGDYSTAINRYESISAYDGRAMVLYNMGNAYMQTGQLGRAIWALEKAHTLAPNESDITHNLKTAAARIQNPYADNTFILLKWWKRVADMLAPNAWSLLFFVMVVMTVYLLSRFFIQKKRQNAGLIGSALLTVLVGSLLWQSIHNIATKDYGIVVKSMETYHTDEGQTQVVERSIPEGTKVKILSKETAAMQIQLPNGIVGYVDGAMVMAL